MGSALTSMRARENLHLHDREKYAMELPHPAAERFFRLEEMPTYILFSWWYSFSTNTFNSCFSGDARSTLAHLQTISTTSEFVRVRARFGTGISHPLDNSDVPNGAASMISIVTDVVVSTSLANR